MFKLMRLLIAALILIAALYIAVPNAQLVHAQSGYIQLCRTGQNPTPDGPPMDWMICFDSNNYGFEFWTNPYWMGVYYFGDYPFCGITSNFIRSGNTSEFIGIFTADELFNTLGLGAYYCEYQP
jgi:hypothetical protein